MQGLLFIGLKKGRTRIPYKEMGGRWKPTTQFWLETQSDMTVFSQVVVDADWSADLVRFKLIILIIRRWREEEKKLKPNKNGGVWRGASFLHEPTTTGCGKNAWKQEGEIENLPQEDRRKGHSQNQALHEREVSGMNDASRTANLSAGEQHQQGGCYQLASIWWQQPVR